MYVIGDLKPGRAVIVDRDPYLITWSQFSKMGRQGGVMATKLKNLKTGAVIQKTFQGSDKLEPADVGYRKVQYLYNDGSSYTFMSLDDYDQFTLPADTIGDAYQYLTEGCELDALVFDGHPIGIQLRPTMDLTITETSPGVKGDTATGGTKPAKLESGFTVNVPLFLKEGDTIRVNTETGMYMSRVE